ncbi:MAG TPA: NAD(P)H-dependent oxidoreductase [Paracoccaceae bacterium]|nr:NAD(P)H-dependent oxidoreductase [Paracoccaceae bacterium]
MAKAVCIIQGHPHAAGGHFCHALADSYARGAEAAGAPVSRLDVAALDPAPLRDPGDFAVPPEGPMRAAQEAVRAAGHLVVIFPLWLGTMPAVVKAFFEQLGRGEFALAQRGGGWPEQKLKGKSARIVVTMGMPGLAYRLIFGAAGVRCLRNGVLGMAGMRPVRETFIGGVDGLGEAGRTRWLARMEGMGRSQA